MNKNEHNFTKKNYNFIFIISYLCKRNDIQYIMLF